VTQTLDWTEHLPSGTDRDRVDLLARESLPAAWGRWFDSSPDRPCVSVVGERTWLTYGELDARSRAVAGRLAGAGFERGARLLVSCAPSIDFVVAYVAAQRLGLVVTPVNSAYTAREVRHIIDDLAPAGALVDDLRRAAWMQDLPVVCGPDVPLNVTADPALDTASREDLALIAYTSGTTGAPKGAMLSTGNLLATAEAVVLAWQWDPSDRLILALPLFHLHGLAVGLNGTLVAGGSVVLVPKFEVGAVLNAARDHDGTLFFGVPTMYGRIAESPRVGELARLRVCVSGSAPMSADLHHALAIRAGQVVLERYGMTETGINTSNPYAGERRPGSVGLPLPGVELRLDERGEILLRGSNVFTGYWKNQAATQAAFAPDGWFRTGDLAAIDTDGYVRIIGRTKELIISGGYNVYPREIEDVLRTHPAVNDVAVAGLPSAEWGETVVAWIVPAETIDVDELIEFARGRLAPYKCPREIRVVEDLPRNALGKVLKNELVALGIEQRDVT
jgi:malonyl-CoA/methylmalonyl-CoA synthetase